MNISLLDFIKEVKIKYKILIFFLILFLSATFLYGKFKSDLRIIEVPINLLKLKTINLQKISNFNFSLKDNLEFISFETIKNFSELEQKLQLNLHKTIDCNQKTINYVCNVTFKFNTPNEDLIRKTLLDSVNKGILEISDFYLKIYDEIIDISSKNITNMNTSKINELTRANNSSNFSKISDQTLVNQMILQKKIFLDIVEGSFVKDSDLIIQDIVYEENYYLAIISSLISALFFIFLLMISNFRIS